MSHNKVHFWHYKLWCQRWIFAIDTTICGVWADIFLVPPIIQQGMKLWGFGKQKVIWRIFFRIFTIIKWEKLHKCNCGEINSGHVETFFLTLPLAYVKLYLSSYSSLSCMGAASRAAECTCVLYNDCDCTVVAWPARAPTSVHNLYLEICFTGRDRYRQYRTKQNI